MFPILYYKDNKGKDRMWKVSIVGDDTVETQAGLVNGKQRVTQSKIRIGKRTVNPRDKAISEAQTKWNTKHKEINRKKHKFSVMLAHKFEDYEKKITYPVITQPKLDGVRCLALRRNNRILLISRNGLEKPNPLQHIKDELETVLLNEEDEFFDGELYTHDLSREKVAGICNTKGPSPHNEKIQYHIFDHVLVKNNNEPFTTRYDRLCKRVQQQTTYLHIVPVHHNVNNRADVIKAHTEYVKQGYEGVMIRIPNSAYEDKRSKNLLKYKEFDDAEFEICGYHEGHGDWANAVIWECWYDKEKDLKFSVKQRGSMDELRTLYKHADRYIGRLLTVRYQSRMANGCPEFGIGIELDRRDL